jgi:hypothetical protein
VKIHPKWVVTPGKQTKSRKNGRRFNGVLNEEEVGWRNARQILM